MRAATEGSLPPVMPQGKLVEVLDREVRQGSPGQLMVESTPSRQRQPQCKTNKEKSDDAADAAALTYLLTYLLRLESQSSVGLRMQPYPRSPDLVWPGHLHGTGCLSARKVGTGFATVVRRVCLGPGCGWVWVLLTPPVLAGVFGGCVWARFVVLSLFCRLFVVFVVGLRFRPAYGTCVVSCPFRLPPAISGSGVRCGRACWARVSAVPRLSWLGCRGVFFALLFFFSVWLCGVGCSVSLSRALWSLSPHPLSFGLGSWLFFFRGVCLHVSVSLCPVGRCS